MLSGKLTKHNRTGATVSFSAPFFHAFVCRKAAKIIQHCGRGPESTSVVEFQIDYLSIQYELD
jgi:hypothetical protein